MSPSPPFGKPRHRPVRRRPLASPHAPALTVSVRSHHAVRGHRRVRIPTAPVHRFLPTPPLLLSVLAVQAALPVSAVAAEGPLAAVCAEVLLSQPCQLSHTVVVGMRAPWALGLALGPNVGSAH
jgi:hypothetical protein